MGARQSCGTWIAVGLGLAVGVGCTSVPAAEHNGGGAGSGGAGGAAASLGKTAGSGAPPSSGGSGTSSVSTRSSAVPSSTASGSSASSSSSGGNLDAGADAADASSSPDASDGGPASRSLGAQCGTANDCDSHYCVDNVCCNSSCNDHICQRCDALSASGAGYCNVNSTQTDPDHECSASSAVCSGTCQIKTTDYVCSGTSFGCVQKVATTNVPSGSVCANNGIVAVSNTNYCATGNSCAGACAGQTWWTSCNGQGACRASTDAADAYAVPVKATLGHTLDAQCNLTTTLLCDNTPHCTSGSQFAGHTCDGTQQCTVDAQPVGCCNDSGCPGDYCVNGQCQTGGLNSPCSVPATYSSTGNCASGYVCTSAFADGGGADYCKVAFGRTCATGNDCGIYWSSPTSHWTPGCGNLTHLCGSD